MTSQWVAVALTLFVCRLSGAQYFTTGRASRFFDVDDSDATVEKPRRLANDSLLVIAQLPSAYVTAFTSVSQRPFSGDDAEAINHLNRHWGTIAMPPFTPFNPQQPYNGGTYASPIVAATATYCPATCTPCSYAQCHDYQVHCEPSVINCCCPSVAASLYDLKDSCDGEEAVAACINGLCGQGYMCTAQRFCCRCASGRSISSCVNGTCPQGFVCNDNNYCCSIDGVSFSTVSGQCVNGRCPVGFICEADNYCHAATPFAGSNNINVSFFTPGVGPVILGKCVNDRCPVGYTCGVGNLCYSNAKIDGHFPVN